MASTTIVPFSTLPACATNCYHLYDANGACVPPAVATANVQQYAECFCSNSYLTPFSTGTAGVCDQACTLATQTNDLASIRNWFTSFCADNQNAVATTTTSTGTGTDTGTSTKSSSTSKSSHKAASGHYSWIDNHWQWVIFIVVVVVGIVAIWVGACFWHRRYLRNKDRQFALNNIRASTGTASATAGLDMPSSQHQVQHHDSMRSSVIPGATSAGSTPTSAPGTSGTYDPSTEKRRSNVLLGRRRN